jgi:outer membrane lipoprotein carrier protein
MLLRPLSVLALLVSALPAVAQEPPLSSLSGADKLNAVLERVSAAQTGLETIKARFSQRKESRLLAEPSVSRGVFYYKAPDRVRWEYDPPRSMSVVLSDGVALTYRPAERRAERIEIGRMQRRVFGFLTATEPLDQLTRYFSVTLRDPGDRGNLVIVLDPTSYHVKKRLSSVTVEIDRQRYLPVAVSYVERDGDSTSFAFSDIRVDQPVPDGLFSLSLPDNVEVLEIKLRNRE